MFKDTQNIVFCTFFRFLDLNLHFRSNRSIVIETSTFHITDIVGKIGKSDKEDDFTDFTFIYLSIPKVFRARMNFAFFEGHRILG